MGGNAYPPIETYGAIGNMRSIALVGPHGSIDWACFPELDSPSVFAALLDRRKGGAFRIELSSRAEGTLSYRDRTNVLESSFADDRGSITVTDFMPVQGELNHPDCSAFEPEIHRVVRCVSGSPEVEIEWTPRFRYACVKPRIERVQGGYRAAMGSEVLMLRGVDGSGRIETAEDGGPTVRARIRMAAGEVRSLATFWGDLPSPRARDSELALKKTVAAWNDWVQYGESQVDRSWTGPYRGLVSRSELALKLLCIHTGAIAAAATTSLPETIGGVRNWDYRYAWLRDAGMTSQALCSIGHRREALGYLHWVEDIAEKQPERGIRLRIMYGIHGQEDLPESELLHLEGYAGSRPVRAGNEAAEQRQLDIYGAVVDAAYDLVRSGLDLEPKFCQLLSDIADRACDAWHLPDAGLWEIRGPERHYTHAKLMLWVCLDRAIRLARRKAIRGDVRRWKSARQAIFDEFVAHAWNEEVGAFVQSYDSKELDASGLLIPLHDMLPFEDPRVKSTIDLTMRELMEDGLVYRYRADDGLPGEEGAFLLTTFWLVDALALAGRYDEAAELFERTARRASPLGLFAEQIDPKSGRFLGNFPQAFSHLGLINSCLYLAHARGERLPRQPLMGTHESEIEDED